MRARPARRGAALERRGTATAAIARAETSEQAADARVLFVARSIPEHPGAGGMERVTWDLAKKMARGAEVTLLTTPVPGEPARYCKDGVTVQALPGLRVGRYSAGWWIRTARYAPADDFDLVMSVSGAATAMVHSRRRPRYVFQAHGTALGEFKNALRVRSRWWPLKAARYAYWTALDSLTYRRVDTVVAASEQVAAALQSFPYRGAWRRTRLQTIPNAVDVNHFAFDESRRSSARERLGLTDDETLIMTISRLDRQKGVDRVIDAAKRLPDPVHLLVGGTGPEEEALRRAGEALGARAHFVGQLDYEAVRDALHAGDVFVLPVRNFAREALPLSVLEALSAGLPAIVPKDSSWPEDIADALTFVDVDDPSKLALAIQALATTRPARLNRLAADYSITEWKNG